MKKKLLALGLALTDTEKQMYHIEPDAPLSPLANAYAKARGADRMSSFGDFMLIGIPYTLTAVIVGYLYLWIVWA